MRFDVLYRADAGSISANRLYSMVCQANSGVLIDGVAGMFPERWKNWCAL